MGILIERRDPEISEMRMGLCASARAWFSPSGFTLTLSMVASPFHSGTELISKPVTYFFAIDLTNLSVTAKMGESIFNLS
jgi:hypothetical protein